MFCSRGTRQGSSDPTVDGTVSFGLVFGAMYMGFVEHYSLAILPR
jgi:hypothetical protein